MLQVATEISGQVDRASVIINRLTELEDKKSFKKEKVQLNDVIQKTIAIVEQQLLLDDIRVSLDLQDRIFEPFFTGKAAGEGAGLGLCISREVVKNHGGRIRVKAWESQGSTFVLSFPKARETGEI